VVTIRSAAAVALLALTLSACGDKAERTNFRPPELGVPAAAADVTGIYRSIHQGLLQLRGNGELNLIVPEGIGATTGSFTLTNGAATISTDNCGDQSGAYTIEVVAGPIVSKSTLLFKAVDDPCAERQKYLTIDPWVYADS
jgi:hypothetical protein